MAYAINSKIKARQAEQAQMSLIMIDIKNDKDNRRYTNLFEPKGALQIKLVK